MGQYHHPVCIEAEEGLSPHGMADGLKEAEQGFNRPSTPNAMVALVCARGGNMPADCSQSPIIGRWAGKRVIVTGDYAEDDDIPGYRGPRLSKLYTGIVHDVMRAMGLADFTLPHSLHPLTVARTIAGPVFTVRGKFTPKADPHETLLAWTGFLS